MDEARVSNAPRCSFTAQVLRPFDSSALLRGALRRGQQNLGSPPLVIALTSAFLSGRHRGGGSRSSPTCAGRRSRDLAEGASPGDAKRRGLEGSCRATREDRAP